jgi:hypothetical protein
MVWAIVVFIVTHAVLNTACQNVPIGYTAIMKKFLAIEDDPSITPIIYTRNRLKDSDTIVGNENAVPYTRTVHQVSSWPTT